MENLMENMVSSQGLYLLSGVGPYCLTLWAGLFVAGHPGWRNVVFQDIEIHTPTHPLAWHFHVMTQQVASSCMAWRLQIGILSLWLLLQGKPQILGIEAGRCILCCSLVSG